MKINDRIPRYVMYFGVAFSGFCLAVSEYISPSVNPDKWSWLHGPIGSYFGVNGKVAAFGALGLVFLVVAGVSYMATRGKK